MQMNGILLAFSFQPVLIEVYREHQQKDEYNDPLRNVWKEIAVNAQMGNVTSFQKQDESNK